MKNNGVTVTLHVRRTGQARIQGCSLIQTSATHLKLYSYVPPYHFTVTIPAQTRFFLPSFGV